MSLHPKPGGMFLYPGEKRFGGITIKNHREDQNIVLNNVWVFDTSGTSTVQKHAAIYRKGRRKIKFAILEIFWICSAHSQSSTVLIGRLYQTTADHDRFIFSFISPSTFFICLYSCLIICVFIVKHFATAALKRGYINNLTYYLIYFYRNSIVKWRAKVNNTLKHNMLSGRSTRPTPRDGSLSFT